MESDHSGEKCYIGICAKVSCGNYSCTICRQIIDAHLHMDGLVNELHNYKTDYAEKDLKDKFHSIRNSLSRHCNDIDSWLRDTCYGLTSCEDALSQINSKIRRVNRDIKYLNLAINVVDRDKNLAIEELKKEQQKKINELNDSFNLEKKKYQNFDEDDKENVLKNKKLEDLTKEKDKIQEDINGIDVSDYIKEEIKKAETDFENEKSKIDENYKVTEEKLEKYTYEEEQMKKKYLEDIKRLKDFSGKIPNYNNWIWSMGLTRYLN